jgi:hypothetical protein
MRKNCFEFTMVSSALLATLCCGCAADFDTKVDIRTNSTTGQVEKRLARMYRGQDLLLVRVETYDWKTSATNLVMEQIYFDSKRVLVLIQTPKSFERTYFATADAGVSESDTNRDGRPDFIAIMKPNGDFHDAVRRDGNGFLEPVNRADLDNAREMLPRFEKGLNALKNEDWPKDPGDEK